MGAINYRTSEYITLGIEPYSVYDLEKDHDFMEEIKEIAEDNGTTPEEEINNYIDDLYQCDYENIQEELKKYHFKYFNVAILEGYYEGFTIDIECNYMIYFDDYYQKQDAQNEITQLKQFLFDCAGLGLVACFPGWCSGYANYKETLTKIREAVHKMREDVKNTPTYKQYEKAA